MNPSSIDTSQDLSISVLSSIFWCRRCRQNEQLATSSDLACAVHVFAASFRRALTPPKLLGRQGDLPFPNKLLLRYTHGVAPNGKQIAHHLKLVSCVSHGTQPVARLIESEESEESNAMSVSQTITNDRRSSHAERLRIIRMDHNHRWVYR